LAFWGRHDIRKFPANASIFLDANTVIYHFTSDPKFGTACTELLKRVEKRELSAALSTHVLADVAHRLMTLEAISVVPSSVIH
jgi:predicted nucleic acid-binding protein